MTFRFLARLPSFCHLYGRTTQLWHQLSLRNIFTAFPYYCLRATSHRTGNQTTPQSQLNTDPIWSTVMDEVDWLTTAVVGECSVELLTVILLTRLAMTLISMLKMSVSGVTMEMMCMVWVGKQGYQLFHIKTGEEKQPRGQWIVCEFSTHCWLLFMFMDLLIG